MAKILDLRPRLALTAVALTLLAIALVTVLDPAPSPAPAQAPAITRVVQIEVDPAGSTDEVGSMHTESIFLSDFDGSVNAPVPGIALRYTITGVNPGAGVLPATGADGMTAVTWAVKKAGRDNLVVWQDDDGDAVLDPGEPSDASTVEFDSEPVPVIGKTVVARVVSGEVFVKVPGTAAARAAQAPSVAPAGFVALKGTDVLPVGAIVHTTRGRVALTSGASRVNGRTLRQRAEFYDGVFQVRQKRAKRPITDILVRSANFAQVCGSGARSAGAFGPLAGGFVAKPRSKRVVSRLRSNATGRFRTVGRRSAATVRGTIWLTEERCEGTLTRVTRGAVSVFDKGRQRTVTVRAGGFYLARAKRASVRRP